jgi:predicted Zn-ribbon and HTH transcriptional regulator
MDKEELRNLMVGHLFRNCKDGKPPPCPICGTSEWTVEALTLDALYLEQAGGMYPLGSSMPVVPIVCKKCGFIYEFAFGRVHKGAPGG